MSKICSILNYFGAPENAWLAPRDEFRNVERLTEADCELFADKSLDDAEIVLEQCRSKNIAIMTIGDADYPDRLRNIPCPPAVLYVRGELPYIDDEPVLAVVGTRKATPYGVSVAGSICHGLAENGMVIVSGLADGIDSAAITGALRAGGRTIGVLGCGADVVYPAKNEGLYREVLESGAIITEFPPGTPPEGHNFPVRNRIMSGLSLGVLVVEAPKRSGALITSSHALEQNRDVFAIPGPLGAVNSEGCNELIRDGAGLVTSAGDILSEYASSYPHKISMQKTPRIVYQGYRYQDKNGAGDIPVTARNVAQVPGQAYSLAAGRGGKTGVPRPGTPADNEGLADGPGETKNNDIIKKVFTDVQRAIIVTMEKGPRHVDDIISETGLQTGEVLASLTMLEISGDVRQLPGKRFEIC